MSFLKNLGAELGTGFGKMITALVSTGWEILRTYGAYLFKIERKPGEHVLHTNTFRIAQISFILSLFFVPGLVNFKNPLTPLLNPNGVYLIVNLSNNPPSFFPRNENFVTEHHQGMTPWREFDNMRLYLYNEYAGESYPTIMVNQKSCAVVPAGKEIGFITDRPPVYAANMQEKVSYYTRRKSMTLLQKSTVMFHYFFDTPQEALHSSNSWKDTVADWNNVDITNYGILAQALNKSDIPDDVAGGLVCF